MLSGKETYQEPIFFDIDNTVVDSEAVELVAAHERLPAAVKSVLGRDLPARIDFRALAGGTDWRVLNHLLDQLGIYDKRENLLNELLLSMETYYYENSPASIEGAVFRETRMVLSQLQREGRPLGIVTGNAGKLEDSKYEGVAYRKLEQAGLLKFFPDQSLWLTGEARIDRDDLLLRAYKRALGHRIKYYEGKLPQMEYPMPLQYIADSRGDWKNILKVSSLIRKELLTSVPVRFTLRGGDNFTGASWLLESIAGKLGSVDKERQGMRLSRQPRAIEARMVRLEVDSDLGFEEIGQVEKCTLEMVDGLDKILHKDSLVRQPWSYRA